MAGPGGPGPVPSYELVAEVLGCMPRGKSAGPDSIPAELLRAGGPTIAAVLPGIIAYSFADRRVPRGVARRHPGPALGRSRRSRPVQQHAERNKCQLRKRGGPTVKSDPNL